MSLMEEIQPEPYGPGLPHHGPLTRADLDRMPQDDGHRYELIDGVLIVTPAPLVRHQIASAALYRLIYAACPAELDVLFAPVDVVLAEDTVMQPDLLVARRADFTENDLPVAPLLAVEVLSPSTRRIDLMLKWSRFEAGGVAAYWAVDPATPSLIAWELRDGQYREVAKVTGSETARLTVPFEVEVTPAELIL